MSRRGSRTWGVGAGAFSLSGSEQERERERESATERQLKHITSIIV